MQRRQTNIKVEQKPGPWLLRVRVQRFDEDINVTTEWTWLARIILFFTFGKWPKKDVKVTRARELRLPTGQR